MRIGTLIMNLENQRMDIRYPSGEVYGGLHCGECFDVNINGKWIPTRIEMGDEWYLVGIKLKEIIGLTVRK